MQRVEFFHDIKNRRTFAIEVPTKHRLFETILNQYNLSITLKVGKAFMVPKEKNYVKKTGREVSQKNMFETELFFEGCYLERSYLTGNSLMFVLHDTEHRYLFRTIKDNAAVHFVVAEDR